MKEMRRIFGYARQLWPYYVTIAALSVLVALISQVRPFMIKAIIDELTRSLSGAPISARNLGIILAIFVSSRILISLFNDLTGYLGDNMAIKMQRLLSQRYYEHLLKLPQNFFDDELTGRLINKLNRSIFEITNFIQTFSNNFLSTILTAVIALGIIAYYSWQAAIMLAVLFPIYFWLTKKASKVFKAKQDIINRHLDEAHGRFAEVISQIRVVKSYVQEQIEGGIFSRHYLRAQRTKREQSWRWHSYNLARNIAFDLVIVGAIGLVGWQALNGLHSIGEFTLLLQLIIEVSFPLFFISFLIDSLQRAQANSKDYFDIMETPIAHIESSSSQKLHAEPADINFKDVNFSYDNNEPVLNGINFNVKPGTKVALIGQSGEGKTTIANLLLRLYDPTSGSITISGQDIKDVKVDSLRAAIGVVFQDASLFSGTVRANIAYGKPRATKAEIVAAAKAANADSFIEKLPQGYDSKIGERGIKLSGGQKQRIAIARAILKDSPILILDEATSSLDSKSEAEVQVALEQLMKNRTSLIIAHRLSTIRNVDLVVALEKGRVSQIGAPAELAKQPGIYKELLDLQDPTKANKQKLKQYEITAR